MKEFDPKFGWTIKLDDHMRKMEGPECIRICVKAMTDEGVMVFSRSWGIESIDSMVDKVFGYGASVCHTVPFIEKGSIAALLWCPVKWQSITKGSYPKSTSTIRLTMDGVFKVGDGKYEDQKIGEVTTAVVYQPDGVDFEDEVPVIF